MSEKTDIARSTITAILLIIAYIIYTDYDMLALSVFIIAYIIVGYTVILSAANNIARGSIFDENFLMTVATVGAFLIGEYPEAVLVMLLYQIGMIFQNRAVNRSRRSIAELMDICPDHANKEVGTKLNEVSPSEVNIGDIIVVKPGERVPLDGRVVNGSSMLDTSALTGESMPRNISAGDEILSGFININSPLRIEVTKTYSDSTVNRVLEMVEDASNRKSRSEDFITRFARFYTPFVVCAAMLITIIPPFFFGQALETWAGRALVFLVISCPCALVISIPLTFFGGIGGASRSGILMKGSNYLEALSQTEVVVFDKTGTLTKGVFKVRNVYSIGMSQTDLIEIAAHAETYSDHPIARSIVEAYGKQIDRSRVSDVTEIPGQGIRADVSGMDVKIGNMRLVDNAYDLGPAGTAVHISIDGRYAGYISMADEVKDDTYRVVNDLRMEGVRRIVLLTGDRKDVGETIAEELGITEVHSEMLPQDKVRIVEEIIAETRGKVVFVGDGVNDAPVLARADIGIAMGALGSDAAMEAADVVLMSDEPSKVAYGIKISKRTIRIAKQNIVFALCIKMVIMVLGIFGYAQLWEAIFADVGVMLIAVFNSMRALRVENSYNESHMEHGTE